MAMLQYGTFFTGGISFKVNVVNVHIWGCLFGEAHHYPQSLCWQRKFAFFVWSEGIHVVWLRSVKCGG